uniref:Uncharacterized protein n=1 Tax=Globodera rostochiensis TaxID=31243 RepID=A0A914I1S0_GLORO
MSDNKSDEEQQQQIAICAYVWLEVFAFIDWSLGSMRIRRATDGNGAQIVNQHTDEWMPIPQGPLPNRVIGFKLLEIGYVDRSVIEFLEHNRLGSSGLNFLIDTDNNQNRSWKIIRQTIWPLVKDNIHGFYLWPSQWRRLRQISPTILRDCANLRSIDSECFPKFPAEDNAGASPARALAKWLLTPRGDGLPKMLDCNRYSAGMAGLKRSFVDASESVNFIIKFWVDERVYLLPFELMNNRTGERLTLRQLNEDDWMLVRCPIGREEDKWAKWEKEAIEWERDRQWNLIAINFFDNGIGDGLVEANEGPSVPVPTE